MCRMKLFTQDSSNQIPYIFPEQLPITRRTFAGGLLVNAAISECTDHVMLRVRRWFYTQLKNISPYWQWEHCLLFEVWVSCWWWWCWERSGIHNNKNNCSYQRCVCLVKLSLESSSDEFHWGLRLQHKQFVLQHSMDPVFIKRQAKEENQYDDVYSSHMVDLLHSSLFCAHTHTHFSVGATSPGTE